jgi:hypothetical protein
MSTVYKEIAKRIDIQARAGDYLEQKFHFKDADGVDLDISTWTVVLIIYTGTSPRQYTGTVAGSIITFVLPNLPRHKYIYELERTLDSKTRDYLKGYLDVKPSDYLGETEGDGTISILVDENETIIEVTVTSPDGSSVDLTNYYTKAEVDDLLTASGGFNPALYYNKTETDTLLDALQAQIESDIDTAVDAAKAEIADTTDAIIVSLNQKEAIGVAATLVANLQTALLDGIATDKNTFSKLYANLNDKITSIQLILNSPDANLDTFAEVVAFITANQDALEAVTINKLNTSVFDAFLITYASDLATKLNESTYNTFLTQYASDLSGKSNVGHTHTSSAISDFASAVAALITGKADTVHTHAISDVTSLQTALDAKLNLAVTIDTKSSDYTLTEADNGKIIEFSALANCTHPSTLSTGFRCDVVRTGSGTVTPVAGGGATLNKKTGNLTEQWSGYSAYHKGSGVWVLIGGFA